MKALTEEEVLSAWGEPPEAVAASLERFSDAARALSSRRPRLIETHPQHWVGRYKGSVEVFGETLASVMKQVEERGIPRAEIIVRFIDRDEKVLFL